AMGLAASVAACFLVFYAHTRRAIDANLEDIVLRANDGHPASASSGLPSTGLTARPRPEVPAAKPIEVGATLVTKAGERRRVSLADGSVLYLNQNSKVTYSANRRIDLSQGEIYVEVTPPSGEWRVASGESKAETFIVKTPARTVSALG